MFYRLPLHFSGIQMKRRIAFFAAVFVLLMTMTVYAGDINENEQRIVSVIYGQFEQDGIIYEVRQEYIDSAMAYLTSDEYDLTADQADSVISEIYENVRTGVESGYLREVGRIQPEEPLQAEPAAQGQPLAEMSGQQETPEGSETERPLEAETEASAETEPPEETTASQPEETAPTPIAIAVLEAAEAAPEQTYAYIRRDTDQRMEHLHIPADMFLVLILICGAVTAACFLLALWLKFVSGRHRHKMRAAVRTISGIAGGAEVYMLLLCAALWIGAFQDSSILNRISDTEYYRAIYDELRSDTGISLALMNIPDSVMDEAITYERVVMAARQQLQNDLHDGNYKANTSLLTDRLRENISAYLENRSIAMTDKSRTGLDILMDRLGTKYENLLRWPFSCWWHDLSIQFRQTAGKSVPVLCVLLILCVLSQHLISHHSDYGVRNDSRILFGGGAALLLTGIVFGWKGLAGWETVTPAYMGQFFGMYRMSVAKAILCVGVCGILLSVAFRLSADSLKNAKLHSHKNR